MPRIVLHLKERDLGADLRGGHLALYRHIRDIAESHDITLDIRQRDPDIRIGTRRIHDDRFDDGNLHIIDDRSLRAPNVLNAAVAYFRGYWHLDPQGTRAFSSIGQQSYDPRAIPFHMARPFFDRLRAHHLHGRRSKYAQSQDPAKLPDGAIAVFFQGSHPFVSGASDITDLEMLQTVLDGAGDRPVVVKLHPGADQVRERKSVRAMAQSDARIILSKANLHDIIAPAAVTVSMNSTVALEGFIHRTPAILFGQADFHHVAGRVRAPADFPAVLSAEMQREGGFAQYLAWYFTRKCLHLASDTLETRIWNIFAQVGFPKERFAE